jgi:PAS domain S-box-containing protein
MDSFHTERSDAESEGIAGGNASTLSSIGFDEISYLGPLQVVQEAAAIAITARDATEMAHAILGLLRKVMHLDAFLFVDFNPEAGQYVNVLAADIVDGEFKVWEPGDHYPPEEHSLFRKTQDGKPWLELRQADALIETDLQCFGDTSRRSASLMFAPMHFQNERKGILSVQSYRYNAYDEGDLELLASVASVIGGGLSRIRIERILARSEEIYRKAIENATGIPYRLRYTDTGYEFIGRGVKTVFGIPQPEFTFARFRDIVQEIIVMDSQGPRDPYEYGKAFRAGKLKQFRVDLRIKTPQGQEKWVNDCAVPIFDPDTGEVVGSLGILMDITERKRIEEDLRRERDFSSSLIQSTPTFYVAISPRGQTLLMNQALLESLGYREDEVLGTDYLKTFVPPEERERVRGIFEKIVEGGSSTFDESPILCKSGRQLLVEWHGRPVTNEQGELLYFFGTGIDITQRRRTEEALKESELRYRRLVERSPDLIGIGSEGTFVFINSAGAALLGASSPEQIVGRAILDFIPPDRRDAVRTRLNRVAENGESLSPYEERLLRLDGRLADVEVSIIAFSYSGRPAIQMLARDISERKSLEADRLKIQKLESTGLLAGGIAHDFNNSLMAIMGNVSLARLSPSLDDETRGILAQTEEACARARDLTQQLLTFSKGGAPVKRTVSIGELVREAVGFALRGSNVLCEYALADDLWPVEADPGQIGQVLHNLAINAQQAMPEGGVIDISARNETLATPGRSSLPEGRYVSISVRDRGVGIPAKHLERIFDPYFTTKQKGSGLGLAIAYSIVKNHGGSIAVESQVGVGTTFHIHLPASNKLAKNKKPSLETMARGSGRVLIMDDEELIRFIACKMLTHLGYQATAVSDGEAAIAAYRKALEAGEKFDAEILDLTIPGGMGGKEAFRRLREIDPDIKGIVSSGYSEDPVMADYRSHGLSGVIAKPYSMTQLSETMAAVLRAGRDSAPGGIYPPLAPEPPKNNSAIS